MKDKLNMFLAGLFVGLVIVGFIFTFFQPTPKITPEEKMKECINIGGEFDIRDWSLRDNGSDYRATCILPEKKVWQYIILIN